MPHIAPRFQSGTASAKVKALTVNGEFQNINDPVQKDLIRTRLLKKHPHLIDFINEPCAKIFSIKIKSFQLLDGVKDAYFEKVDSLEFIRQKNKFP